MNKSIRLLVLSLGMLILGACGGGGGGGSTTAGSKPSTLTFPLAQAIANFVSSSHNYNYSVTGNVNGKSVTGSGTVSYAAAVGATFEGQPALKNTITISGNVAAGGNTAPYAFTGEDYFTTNYDPLGSSGAGGVDYCVAQNNQTYPSTVKVGDTATIGTDNCYADSTKNAQIENDVNSYLVEADSATSALVNLITNTYSLTSTLQSTAQTRFRIDQNGNANLVSVTFTDYTASPATVLTFTVH